MFISPLDIHMERTQQVSSRNFESSLAQIIYNHFEHHIAIDTYYGCSSTQI